jgi:hypothetical protein
LNTAVARGVITRTEADAIERADALRREAIMVDDFPTDLGRSEIYRTSQAVTADELRAALGDAIAGDRDTTNASRTGGGAWQHQTST